MNKNLFFIILSFILNQALLASQENRIVLYRDNQIQQNNDYYNAEKIREQLRQIYTNFSLYNKTNTSITSQKELIRIHNELITDIETLKKMKPLIKNEIATLKKIIIIKQENVNNNNKLITSETQQKNNLTAKMKTIKNNEKKLSRPKKTNFLGFIKKINIIGQNINNLESKNSELNNDIQRAYALGLSMKKNHVKIIEPICTIYNVIKSEIETSDVIWKPLSLNHSGKNEKTIKYF